MQLSLFDLPWWGDVLVTLGLTHITIVAVTVFLHRHQSHRAVALHPLVTHFFRFWLWLTTGIITREWVAIHRKHHATTETPTDPHSPQVHGIRKVLFQGAELYRAESSNSATLEKYGHSTPDDWIERKLYARHSLVGVGVMLVIDLLLFGPIGLSIWAVQMLWIPFFAAGVINGVGHYWGYRNFAASDASKNIVPWGILIGGEELHNNHHAYVCSARFSNRWWEFDVGWMYIRMLEALHLATVRRVAPKVRTDPARLRCDANTLESILLHRFEVLARFARALRGVAIEELRSIEVNATQREKDRDSMRNAVKHWLRGDHGVLAEPERLALEKALHSSPVLSTLYAMRRDLTALWSRSNASKAQLVKQLDDWCQRAEASGIAALGAFSLTLRAYYLPAGDM